MNNDFSLLPKKPKACVQAKREAIEEIIKLGVHHKLAGLDWKLLRDQGRQ